MMILRGAECAGLFVILVNATILVIISAQRLLAEAATVPAGGAHSRPLDGAQHQQARQATSDQRHNKLRPPHTAASRAGHARAMPPATAPTAEPAQRTARLLGPSTAQETNALAYLQRYGYMQAPTGGDISNNLISEESFSGAIAEFQRFAGLPETGLADNQTLAMMQTPRCGNSDKPPAAAISKTGQLTSRAWMMSGPSERAAAAGDSPSAWPTEKRRRKRYALQGSKWRRQELTYRISQYPTKFSSRRHEVDSQIERAFGIWSQVAPIDFVVKKEGRVHIDIRFASGDHGDGDAFDGPGNTLAHAYFPQYGGDAHFDDQEFWTVDSYAGTNIFQVAAHELGHSLGLGHSNVREALMAPFYQKYKPNFKLHIDDVLAIQALYGEKAFLPEVPGSERAGPSTSPPSTTTAAATTTTTASTTTSTSTERPSVLFGGRSPPIYRGNRRPSAAGRPNDEDESDLGGLGPFGEPPGAGRDENATPDLSTNGINGFGEGAAPEEPAAAGPADLCSDSAVDTVTRTEDGNTYVFKGNYYWLVTNEGLARGYPRRISADWEGLPGKLDAALTWADGKTFFFKGNKYWRFRNRRRDFGYPKLISAGFAGIPDDIDAAFVWSGNGRTYFFKGADYWRFDSKAEPPVSGDYPRPIKVWLGVPAHINAAFKWDNNVTYFFKGNQYYRFNDREFKVESRGRPPFPRQTSEWWFGCVNSNLAQRALPAAAAIGGQARSIAGDTIQQHPHPAHHTGRTARLHPNPAQRVAAAALQSMPAGAPNSDHADWSFLAGLSADQTRSMGTHISDQQKPPTPAAPPPPPTPSDRRWREEETISEPDMDRRLAPAQPFAPAGTHREPLYNANSDQERRRPTRFEGADGADRHRTGFELGVIGASTGAPAHGGGGPQYQTSSATTAILLDNGRNGPWSSDGGLAATGRWLSVLCGIAITWLGALRSRHAVIVGSHGRIH